jgi:hypothetical protein
MIVYVLFVHKKICFKEKSLYYFIIFLGVFLGEFFIANPALKGPAGGSQRAPTAAQLFQQQDEAGAVLHGGPGRDQCAGCVRTQRRLHQHVDDVWAGLHCGLSHRVERRARPPLTAHVGDQCHFRSVVDSKTGFIKSFVSFLECNGVFFSFYLI